MDQCRYAGVCDSLENAQRTHHVVLPRDFWAACRLKQPGQVDHCVRAFDVAMKVVRAHIGGGELDLRHTPRSLSPRQSQNGTNGILRAQRLDDTAPDVPRGSCDYYSQFGHASPGTRGTV